MMKHNPFYINRWQQLIEVSKRVESAFLFYRVFIMYLSEWKISGNKIKLTYTLKIMMLGLNQI